jgi:tRNA(Ile)-lysidine synthase
MSLLQKFQEFIGNENLFSSKDKLLLAVSGGLDSVVLCELCYQAGFDFIIVHCNFQLRNEESERDEKFVQQLAEKYNKEFLVGKFDTKNYAMQKKISIQVAARELRYNWFFSIVGRLPMTYDRINNESTNDQRPTAILTAHHQDDNIETILMNFFKGTGIAGLRGILPKQEKIIRPLLFAKKEELKQFALENNLSWVEDSSNESDKYSRNFFRHQVIPLVRKIYPAAIDNLADNIDRFRDIELLYYQSINQHKKNLLEQKGDEIHIPVLKLKKSPPLNTIIFEIIEEYHFSAKQVEEVVNLLDSESGKFIQSSSHRILKNRNWLIISPNQNKSSQTILIEEKEKLIVFEKGNLHITIIPAANFQPPTVNSIAFLDAATINFPLLLRKWKQGDYFYPLGMTKKKKLNRFFIDNKLSQTEKEKTWVVEMNKKIIWVVGLRIDNRFKITPNTKQALRMELK